MNLPPKTIAVLGVVQLVLIVLGFFVTGAFLHVYEKIEWSDMGLSEPQVPGLVAFVRAFGLWLVIVPIAWVTFAAVRGENVCGIQYIAEWDFVMGIALTVGLAILFFMSSCSAMRLLSLTGG